MDLKKDIREHLLVFLDLETTGLLAESSSICEVAALKINEKEVIDKFHTLVRPRHKVSYPAFCIHKISDQDLIGSPRFEDIAGKLVDFLSESILCAYNVSFDLGFLNHQLKKISLKPLEVPFLDVLTMARSTINLKSYKLESVARFFGLTSNIQFHRAEADAYITYLIFNEIIKILNGKQSLAAQELINLYGNQLRA